MAAVLTPHFGICHMDSSRWLVVSGFRRARLLTLASCVGVLAPGLSGCDQLGIETPQKTAERQQADAKAVGSACRHAMRAIEDCYVLNPKADKSSVFAGWRDMDEYMRENKLEGIAPVVPRPVSAAASKASAPKPAADDEEEPDTAAPKGVRGDGVKAKSKAAH
jgi:hypothetical protein